MKTVKDLPRVTQEMIDDMIDSCIFTETRGENGNAPRWNDEMSEIRKEMITWINSGNGK